MAETPPHIFKILILSLLFGVVIIIGIYQQSEIIKIKNQLEDVPKRYCNIEKETQKLIVTTSANSNIGGFPIHNYDPNNEINCEEGVKFENRYNSNYVYNPTSEPKTCLITIEREVCIIK